jgi:hypothetical protein
VSFVIPAKAGIHFDVRASNRESGSLALPRVRNDGPMAAYRPPPTCR